MNQNKEYILGTAQAELERLVRQDQTWSAQTEDLLGLAGFSPGQHVADLGCGPGLTSERIAKLVGRHGRVTGLDNAERFRSAFLARMRQSELPDADFQLADVTELPLANNSVDGVMARWLLCFVSDPNRVIAEAVRILRPGGVIAVLDYFNYHAIDLEPPSALFKMIFQNVDQSVTDSGGDLNIGGRLPQMMLANGLEVQEIVPIQEIGRPKSQYWNWVTEFQALHLDNLVTQGYITQGELDEFKTEWTQREKDPASFFFTPPMVGVVGVKA